MKNTLPAITLAMLSGLVCNAKDQGKLENSSIAWQWDLSSGKLVSVLHDKTDGRLLNIQSECSQLLLGDGRIIKASDLKQVGAPRTSELPADSTSPTVARQFPGRQVTLEFSDEPDHLMATWQ